MNDESNQNQNENTGVPTPEPNVQPDVNPIPVPAPLPTEPPAPTAAPAAEPLPTAAPSAQETVSAPVVSEPEAASQASVSSWFLLAFLITGGVLIMTFYGALLWALWTGNAANPLFETLGIEASGLKSLLLNLTNLIFGALALIFLITTLVFIFRWSLSKPTDTNKGYLLRHFVLYLFFFFLSCGSWLGLYYFIDQVSGRATVAVDNSLIATTPENVIGLSAPVTINFDIGTRMFERIPSEVIRQINWDFDGDGTYDASGPNVTYRFLNRGENNGRFPVTAEIFYFSTVDGQEVSFKSEREVIIDNENVSAVLNAAPESGPFPLEVEFNAGGSKDPDGEVIMYEFDLDGDGEFEIRQESPIITETFLKVGEYRVKVRATGQNSDTSVAERLITVQTPESDLKAEITSADSLEGYAPLKISFDGGQSFVKEGVITQYEWFVEGEDEPVLGRKLQRIFREPGEYQVSLTVQNDLGERQRTEKLVTVFEDDINAKVDVRTTPTKPDNGILRGRAPFRVSFDASNSRIKEPLEWQWDFDNDGIVDEFGEAVQFVFREPQTYETRLVIIDSDKVEHEAFVPVQVERAGVTAVIAAQPYAGPAPLKVKFDGSGSTTDEGEIVNYIWEFPGREPINYGAQIEYEFSRVGNYIVRMSVLTSEGKTSRDEIIVSARAPIVSADFKMIPTSGTAPMLVQATPNISKGIIREYEWDWGDGSPLETLYGPESVQHTYTQPGTYNVTLRLTDQNGIVSEQIQSIEIQ